MSNNFTSHFSADDAALALIDFQPQMFMGVESPQAWREAGSLFDTRERSALAWTETVTRVADTAVPDADFQAASAVFSEKELADLTIAIGLMNAYNRLAIGFRVPPKAALSEHQDQVVANMRSPTPTANQEIQS
jgi:hypothetical protein